VSAAPAPRLYDPETSDAPRRDPRAFRHGAPPSGRPQGPAARGNVRSTPSRGGKPGGRPPRGPGGPGRGNPRKSPPKPTKPTRSPLGLRLALLPIRLALVPLRLAGLVLGRITGGRPWLALVLALGCGVIFIHAATLKTNQLIEQRDAQISALERSTASLRNSVAELGSTDRISRVGREAGMVFPDPEGIGYLDARKARAERAAKTFGPPSAAWQPAPNPSSQNGDALNPDGTAIDGGSAVADGAVAQPGSTDGTAQTATGTADATGQAPVAAPTTGDVAGTAAETTPSTGTGTTDTGDAATTGEGTGATGAPSAATGDGAAPADGAASGVQSGGATGGATP
jgi:hypothetical protein